MKHEIWISFKAQICYRLARDYCCNHLQKGAQTASQENEINVARARRWHCGGCLVVDGITRMGIRLAWFCLFLGFWSLLRFNVVYSSMLQPLCMSSASVLWFNLKPCCLVQRILIRLNPDLNESSDSLGSKRQSLPFVALSAWIRKRGPFWHANLSKLKIYACPVLQLNTMTVMDDRSSYAIAICRSVWVAKLKTSVSSGKANLWRNLVPLF